MEQAIAALGATAERTQTRVEALEQRLDGLQTLVGEVSRLAAAVTAGAGGGDAPPGGPQPSWFDVDDPDVAAAMLADLIPWVSHVLRPQLPASSRRLPDCWLHHPVTVEELLALRLVWLEAYRDPDARPSAAAEWQQRWLPGWTGDDRGKASQGRWCDGIPAHVGKPAGGATLPDFARDQVLLELAPRYARWWVVARTGAGAGPEPGIPVE